MKQAQVTRHLLATLALVSAAAMPFAASANEATKNPADTNKDNFVSAKEAKKHANTQHKMSHAPADTNKDGYVSRQEFMDHHAAMWDKHHPEMMKRHSGMKADMMDMKQYREFDKSIRLRDGRVDPGKIGGM